MKIFSYFFCLLGLCLNQQLTAQTSLSPWSMEWHYTPQYVDYHAPQRGSFVPAESGLRPGYSFTLGLGIYRQLNSRVSLNTGLAFFSALSESLDSELRWGNEHNGQGGWGGNDPSNPNRLSFQEHLYYVQIPLQIQVYLSNGAFRFYAKSGLQLEYLVARRSASQVTHSDGSQTTTHSIGEDNALRPLNVLANVGFGLEYTRKSRQTFFLEPEARMTLLGVSKNALYPSRRYDLGIRTGFRLRFAKN